MSRFFEYVKEEEAKAYVHYRSGKPSGEIMRWLASQPDAVEWLKRHPGYAENVTVLEHTHDFLEYLSVDADSPLRGCGSFAEMVAVIDGMKAREQKEIGRYCFGFCNAQTALRSSKVTTYNRLRSLFRYVAREMYFLDGERLPWVSNPSPLRVDFEATKADLIRVLSCIDEPRWRSVFVCKFQMMVGEVEFEWFARNGWPLIEGQVLGGVSLNGRPGCAVFMMPPRPKIADKGSLPYPTSIEADGVRELRRYFEERGVPGRGEPIWVTSKGNPLSVEAMGIAWRNYLRKSGVVKVYSPGCPRCGVPLKRSREQLEGGRQSTRGSWRCPGCGWRGRREGLKEPSHGELSRIRYGFGLHEMSRDLTSSELEIAYYRTGVPQWLTHVRMGNTSKVDSNQYQKITQKSLAFAEELFEKVSPWLNVLSVDPEKVPRAEVDRRIKQLSEEQDRRIRLIEERLGLNMEE